MEADAGIAAVNVPAPVAVIWAFCTSVNGAPMLVVPMTLKLAGTSVTEAVNWMRTTPLLTDTPVTTGGVVSTAMMMDAGATETNWFVPGGETARQCPVQLSI